MKTQSFTQSTLGKEVCTVCKPSGRYQGKPYTPDKKSYHADKGYKQRPQQKQEHLSAAKPVAHSEHSHRRAGGARGDYTIDMEDSLQNLSLNDSKEENMIVSQVDGLVDYSSSEEEDSDNSSDGKPHIWEVPDSKTWALHQLEKLRQHPDYEKIINYRDDGDSKWHKKVSSILNKMTLSGIACGDLYNDKQITTSKWVHDSSPDSSSSKRSSKDAGLDADYPEWGITGPTQANPKSSNPS